MQATPSYLSPLPLQSLAVPRLAEIIGGRNILIWGAAFVGQGLAQGLTRAGFKPAAFLDQSPRLSGRIINDLPVQPPEPALAETDFAAKNFIFMASGYWESQMQSRLESLGLKEGRDFLSSGDLTPVQPAVEISGVCNLRCQGCPRGNMERHPPAGFMTAADYALVLDKLLREMPLLGSLQLYTWGEPLLNPDFFEIIRLTRERGVLSIVSTNLNVKMDMSALAENGPDLLRLSSSGFGPGYEETHTGGHWPVFWGNFERLAQVRRQQAPEMNVELYYHLYRHNQGDQYRRMKEAAEGAGFIFRPVWGCLYPWDNLADLAEGRPLPEAAARHLELVIGDLPAILKAGQLRPHDPPCSLVKCFPIDWDRSVLSCGTWYRPRLAPDFLDKPLAELIQAKIDSAACRRCAGLGIHQVNFPFMADRTADMDDSDSGQ